DKPAADLLPPDEADVGGLDHGVGGLDGADEPAGLDETEGSGGNASVPVPVSGHGGCFLPLVADDRGPAAGCRLVGVTPNPGVLHLGHVLNPPASPLDCDLTADAHTVHAGHHGSVGPSP